MRIIVFGANGMLGNAILRVLCEHPCLEVWGTVRSLNAVSHFSGDLDAHLITGIDVENQDLLAGVVAKVKPEVVINCVGLVKQLQSAQSPLAAIPINSLLPYRLATLCSIAGARLIHISTDCVFSGDRGGYTEDDPSDARDVYGKTKFLGEVTDSHTITLRTSIIGHELQTRHGLVEWFLSQERQCKGYTNAIFSGLPTVVLARIIRDIVILRPDMSGLYHVASSPISKYELLKLISNAYSKAIEIIPDGQLVVDRTLNAERFRRATGYVPPEWSELVKMMFEYK